MATASPALPTFSYAQAAKGLTPVSVQTQPAKEANLAPPDDTSSGGDISSSRPSRHELTSRSTQSKEDETFIAADREASKADLDVPQQDTQCGDKENQPPAKQSRRISGDETKVCSSEDSSPSFGATSSLTLAKEDLANTQNESSEMWDKQSQISTTGEKSMQSTEQPKAKEADEDWEKLSAAKSELKAAPIPIVNVWQARKEAQDARFKALANQRGHVTASNAAKVKAQPPSNTSTVQDNEQKQHGKSFLRLDKDEASVKRRQGSVEHTKPHDDGRRQSRQSRSNGQEKESADLVAPPPVGDAKLWPTPETATTEERKKSLPQDKAEKPESKTAGTRPHGKQWVHVPYVPSAKFVTPLPPVAARRGGRPATRGGRDSNGRGGHAPQNSLSGGKGDTNGSMGPPALPTPASEQERGRNHELSENSRAISAPSRSRRTASADDLPLEHRKFSVHGARDRIDFGTAKKATPTETPRSVEQPKEEFVPTARYRQDPRPFSKPNNSSNTGSFRAGIYETSKYPGVSVDAQSHPRPEPSTRRSSPSEGLVKDPEISSPRERVDLGKERALPRTREYNKEQSDYSSRDKVESWRDRESSGDRPERREPRSERGRGSYRGRGNHNAYTMPITTAHAFTAPLPQQPFTNSKSHSYQGTHRQPSQHYPVMHSHTSQRSSLRSHSIPTGLIYSPMPNGIPPLHPQLSPLQTDMSVYSYPPSMQPGIMSAIPYHPAHDTFALMAMVSQQMEYYFSIDNLCKDLFLRHHMDSQGYVLLSVIAEFKRIKALTEDIDLLRHVCSQSRSIEFRQGEDGIDRMRRRDGWDQWVRPMAERAPSARNDGPPSPSRHSLDRSSSYEVPNVLGLSFPAVPHVTSPSWSNLSRQEQQPVVDRIRGTAATFTDLVAGAPISDTLGTTDIPQIPVDDHFSLSNGNGAEVNEHSTKSLSQADVEHAPDTTLSNGHVATQYPAVDDESVFPNDQIDELTVVSRKNEMLQPLMRPPFIALSNRTFSHGSIDDQSLSNDAYPDSPGVPVVASLRGGAGSLEQLDTRRAQRLMSYPAQLSYASYRDDSLPVFWVKDGAPPVGLHQDGLAHERYHALHDRAIEQRLSGDTSADMEVLYQFWSHFLIRNFNLGMYTEFRDLALQDAKEGVESGSKHLVRYYEALLSGQNALTERLAGDLVNLAESERGEERPAFQKLRAAWRNGAFNLKSRKKVDNVLSANLRADLEK